MQNMLLCSICGLFDLAYKVQAIIVVLSQSGQLTWRNREEGRCILIHEIQWICTETHIAG
jgi:hypothetical protein